MRKRREVPAIAVILALLGSIGMLVSLHYMMFLGLEPTWIQRTLAVAVLTVPATGVGVIILSIFEE